MSVSESPCHFSGSGRSAFDSSWNDCDVHRELAELGLHDLALDADPVAAVDLVAEARELVRAELALAHEELQLAAAVADLGEDELALRALQQHPARDADDVVGRGAGVDLVVPVRRAPRCSVCVRSKRTGYGSSPRARIASTLASRAANSSSISDSVRR